MATADTDFLVAFGNRKDCRHAGTLAIAEGVTEPLVTCEAVLAETAFHLGSSALVLAFLHDGLVRSAFVLSEHIPRLAELAKRYADRQPDLADLCLIRLSELHPRYPVITTDLADLHAEWLLQKAACSALRCPKTRRFEFDSRVLEPTSES